MLSKLFVNYFISGASTFSIRLKRLSRHFIKATWGELVNFFIDVAKKFWNICAAFVIAGGDVRGGAGDGALRESLLDLQQRQCYRNRPHDQSHGTQRSQCTLP